jgi:hypothetical protein
MVSGVGVLRVLLFGGLECFLFSFLFFSFSGAGFYSSLSKIAFPSPETIKKRLQANDRSQRGLPKGWVGKSECGR